MPLDGGARPTVAADLIKAKAFLTERGWCSSGANGPGGTLCMAAAVHGALMAELDPESKWWRQAAFLRRRARAISALGEAVGLDKCDPGVLGKWNDTLGRTYDQVLRAFDTAIAMEILTCPSMEPV